MTTDYHLHTLVSDGALAPVDVLRAAAAHGLTQVSLTDHDSLGAYRLAEGAVFDEARRLGLSLTVGIEMDADLDGVEVHLLGYGVSLDDAALTAHLEAVRTARFERARREIGIVNQLLGDGAISEAEVFAPGRETLMKPHFIHPLLERGRFPSYEEANAWYRRNVKAGVKVPKPSLGEAIGLVHHAGGWAVLAHPAYYERDGAPVLSRLAQLQNAGLDGVEADYPYHACSPNAFSPEREREFAEQLRHAAEPLGLRFTRGSDAHTLEDFRKVYG